MLRIIYITGLLIANIANTNKQVIKEKQKEQHLDDYLPRASQYQDYSYYWYEYERLLRTILSDYDNLSPEYITFAKEIDFVVLDKKVTYIDFVSDDGFVVLDKDTIYEYETDIDLSKIHESDFCYDPYDKFILKNERGGYERIFNENHSEGVPDDKIIVCDPQLHYGQDKGGDGEIYDLDAYVSERYPGYVLEQKSYLKNYGVTSQWYNSAYYQMLKKVVNGVEELNYSIGPLSEGNCVINATYSILSNLVETVDNSGVHRQFCPNFASGLDTYDYSTDIHNTLFCQTYVDAINPPYTRKIIDDYIYNSYWFVNDFYTNSYETIVSNLPSLYVELYEQAWMHGYFPSEGMLFSESETIVQSVDGNYGYNIDFLRNSSVAMAIQNVNYGIPSFIGTQKSETYHNHGMSVYGYAIYKLANSNSLDYKYFLMVDSGRLKSFAHSDDFYDLDGNPINWYDINAVQDDNDNKSYIVLNTIYKETIGWPLC